MTEKLLELANRCETAAGPDRQLDADIAVAALGFFIAEPRYQGADAAYGYVDRDGTRVEPGHGGMQLIRNFTESIDAAMTLVPVLNAQSAYPQLQRIGVDTWQAHLGYANKAKGSTGTGRSGALALCAAALRACIQRSDSNE